MQNYPETCTVARNQTSSSLTDFDLSTCFVTSGPRDIIQGHGETEPITPNIRQAVYVCGLSGMK